MAVLRIFLLDDQGAMKKDLENSLRNIGVECDIKFFNPDDRSKRFGGCQLPTGSQWNQFDIAFLDNELFTPENDAEYDGPDLRGGSEILPYVRSEAPWIPVIGYSHLLGGRKTERVPPTALPLITGFGFDVCVGRNVLANSPLMTRGLWNQIIKWAEQRRLESVVGPLMGLPDKEPDVVVSTHLKEDLDARIPNWQQLVVNCFRFASKVTLEEVRNGYSGAIVFRAFVVQSLDGESKEGEWLLKISDNPWKLHRELRAHQIAARSGLDFARITPLLWREIVKVGRWAAIAYQFACGTLQAGSLFPDGAQRDRVLKALSALLSGLYPAEPRTERVYADQVVSEWFGSCPPKIPSGEPLSEIARERIEEFFGSGVVNQRSLKVKHCMVHGDLHLDNVMVGPSSGVLIDFARSRCAPLAVDAAKLIMDFLIRTVEFRGNVVPMWNNVEQPVHELILAIDQVFDFDADDRELFFILLTSNLISALSFRPDSMASGTVAWIAEILKSLPPRQGTLGLPD